jgi:adenosylmethionine-8-amino-7-oxononanoate aminotransferase
MTGPSHWHPFADMHSVSKNGALTIERGDGIYVFDSAGKRYLDATASLWYCMVGHGRASIASAVAEQMAKLEAYSTFGDFTNRPIDELADRLVQIAPMPDAAIFFTSGGSDCVDTAVKLARKYWLLKDQTDRRTIIVREGAYHGMHAAGTGLAGIEPNRADYSGLLPDVVRVPWDSSSALEKAIAEVGRENVAAFFCEPVIGAGGIFHPPEGYLREVAEICETTGVLLVMDEVVTGFGRLGDWFASTRYGISPDMVISAKGLTSGYLPMGALFVGAKVREPFYDGSAGLWRHGYTYSGHATAAAAALANLDIMATEQLPANARQMESVLAETLNPLVGHSLVSEVRVAEGLLAAVQLDPARLAGDAGLPGRAVAAMRTAGLATRSLATGAIHVSPPLTISEDQLQELAGLITEGLDAVA